MQNYGYVIILAGSEREVITYSHIERQSEIIMLTGSSAVQYQELSGEHTLSAWRKWRKVGGNILIKQTKKVDKSVWLWYYIKAVRKRLKIWSGSSAG